LVTRQAYVISTERLARRWGNIENLLRHEHLQSIDDQNQLRIRLETAAVEGIFELAEGGALELAWSFMLDYENSLNPQKSPGGKKGMGGVVIGTLYP
jgi:hypothetical protein